MPTYNHELFIHEAVQSCLNQTYKNIQIVISDDGSIDQTASILEKYSTDFPDIIKLNINKVNLGLKINANLCLSLCEGEYIVFFSGDDVMHPKKIETQIFEFLNNEKLVLCGHRFNYIDCDSNLISTGRIGKDKGFGLKDWLTDDVLTNAPSIMVKSERIPSTGYDLRLNIGEKKLWIDIVGKDGEFLYLDKVLGDYRRHSNNLSSEIVITEDSKILLEMIREEYSDWLPKSYLINFQSSIYFSESSFYFKNRRWIFFLIKMLQSLYCSPLAFLKRLALLFSK
jgi:glycosyltransferase involved in cell wall biosynthesis